MRHQRIKTRAGRLTVPVLDMEATSKLHVTWHWTASGYTVAPLHKRHYHFIIGGDGKARHGVPIERNVSTKCKRRSNAAEGAGLIVRHLWVV